MPVWKVLFIALLATACLGLALATVIVPMTKTGGEWWLWIGGLLAGTACAGGLFALFLRHAGGQMEGPRR